MSVSKYSDISKHTLPQTLTFYLLKNTTISYILFTKSILYFFFLLISKLKKKLQFREEKNFVSVICITFI